MEERRFPDPAWFGPAQQAGLLDFWRVYESHYEQVAAETLTVAREIPAFAQLIRATPEDLRARQSQESRDRLRRAVAGEWAAYEQNLRQQATTFVKLGIAFEEWYLLMGSFQRFLRPHLIEAYLSSPARLDAALGAMLQFTDRTMAILGAEYLGVKEASLRESEQSLSTTLDSIGDAVISTDAEGKVSRMNPVAQALTGWPLAEARGRPLQEVFRIVNETTRASVENPVTKVLREGTVVGLANHTVLLARDGAMW